MKVKTLLKTLNQVEYSLLAESGWLKEKGYVDAHGYDYTSNFEDAKVIKITTVKDCDELFITIKD